MRFREARVFHSVGKTVATMLENAGVAENVAAEVIGHEDDDLWPLLGRQFDEGRVGCD